MISLLFHELQNMKDLKPSMQWFFSVNKIQARSVKESVLDG